MAQVARVPLASLAGVSLIKRQMDEAEERGWSSGGDKHVSAEHVEDDALAQLITESASAAPCSYCGREGGAPLDVLIERIGTSLPAEWGNADDEGVGWEGGYVGKTYDTWDLITETGDPPLNHSELIADVVRALPVKSSRRPCIESVDANAPPSHPSGAPTTALSHNRYSPTRARAAAARHRERPHHSS